MNKPKEFLIQWVLTFSDRWIHEAERCDAPWYAHRDGFSAWNWEVVKYFDHDDDIPGSAVRINQAGLGFIKEK